MSNRKVYLGPNNNHMKEELQTIALKYLKQNKGDKFFYVLPNRELLTCYRQGFIDKLGGSFDMNIISFDDIVSKILEDKAIKLANDPIKRVVMRKVLEDLGNRGQLNYYKNFIDYTGFIESCIYIIGSIKKSLITWREYLLKCPEESFYKEIGLVYKGYEEELKDKGYFDKDSIYLESIDLLNSNKNFLHDLDFIIIDEFYDFRPIELEILNSLKNLDIDIFINIPYKIGNKNKRLDETISALKSLGFQIEDISKENYSEFENLGNSLFHNDSAKIDANVELIKASSLYLEVKKILKIIKNNYHYNSIDLKDNCICIFNDEYADMIFKVAKEENIPLSMDKTIPLKSLPLTREITTLLELNIYSGKKDIVLDRFKSAYLSICDQGRRDRLEYILRKSKFNNIDDLWDKINNNNLIDIPQEYIDDIKNILIDLDKEVIVLKENKTLKEFNKVLRSILDDYNLEKNILDRFKINNNYQLLQRDMASLKCIKNILNTMEATLFINEEINLQEYLMILDDYFKEENIMESKGNPNGVKLIRIDNARGIDYRKVFIPGLTQGIYPKLGNDNFFFSDDNLHSLKNIGIDIKDYRNRLDNEILKFASLISSCKEKLYISCNFKSEGGQNPLYSIFLDEVLHKLKGEKEEDKLKVTELDLEFLYCNEVKEITNDREFSFKICNDYYNDALDMSLLQYYNSLYDGRVESINLQFEPYTKRSLEEFNCYSGLLESDFPVEYISNIFDGRKFSVSFLENYLVCPYSFLLGNMFNIDQLEREIQDYNPRDNGTIYHEVLRIYYEKYKEDFVNIEEFITSNTYDFLKDTLLSEAGKLGYSIDSKRQLLVIEDMYNKLERFIEKDIQRLKDNPNIKPWSFEQWFSMNFKLDSKNIEIRGIIDRIDKIDDNKYIIIDYKSSEYGKKTIEDIINKISLQLPLYIMSQSDKNVIGGVYGTIKDQKFHNCIGLLGETSLVSKGKGAIDRDTWDQVLSNTQVTIGEIVRGISGGKFSVNPKVCSSYCIYKDICRYDKVQEVEK